MDFFEVVEARRSVRSYLDKEVEQEKIQKILETVNKAPSAGNLQGYEVIIVRDANRKAALRDAAYGQTVLTQVPVALVFCADHLLSSSKYGSRGYNLYAIQDATIAAAYCQLAATALGLATVWVGAFDPEAVAKAVETPEGITPVAIIPIGYAAESPEMRPRRDLNDLVRCETWSNK